MTLGLRMLERKYELISEEEIDRLINIQNTFYGIDESNIAESIDQLKELDVVTSKENCEQFARLILSFLFVHPRVIPLFADMIKAFQDDNEFKEIMYLQIFHSFFRVIEEMSDHYQMSLLYHCMSKGIYSPEKIISTIKENFITKKHFQIQHAFVFLYFAPEIEENDMLFFKKYRLNALLSPNRCSISSIISEIDTYSENNWFKLKEMRSLIHCGNKIFKIILEDDVNAFRALAATANFDLEQSFVLPPLSPFHYLEENPPLISVAAAVAAVNIFKYLISNNVKMDVIVPRFGSLAQNAIVGGNLEIIRLVEQYGGDFKGTLPTSVRYYHNDIFHWLHDTKFPTDEDLLTLSPTKSTVLSQSSAVCNIYIMNFCMERGLSFELSPDAEFETTYLDNACYMGYLDLVKMMIDYGKNEKQTGLCYYLAAKNGHHQLMDLLYQTYHFNPSDIYEERDALAMTLFNSHRTTFEKLLKLPDLEIRTTFEDGLTTTVYGASQGDVELMKMLREKLGPKEIMKKVQGQPLYFYSVILSHYEMTQYLISLPEMKDYLGVNDCLTAAIIAIGKRSLDIVRLLPCIDEIIEKSEGHKYINQICPHYQQIVKGIIPDDYELVEDEYFAYGRDNDFL